MWNDYFRFGTTEIVNTERVVALAQASSLPLGVSCGDCGSIPDFLRSVYSESDALADIEAAPWYDEDDPASESFVGVVGLKVANTLASTREVPITQRLGNGGVLGRERLATRDVRVTGLIFARDAAGADYGFNWLSSALSRSSCSQHDTRCGLANVEWLVDCPPAKEGTETDEQYAERVHSSRRLLHDTAATSGPLLLEERENACWVVYEIEFTITSQEPSVLGAEKEFTLTPETIDGKSDVVRNLVRSPSAEISTTLVQPRVAINFVENPSFEGGTSGWSTYVEVVSGDTPPGPSTISAYEVGEEAAVAGSWYAILGLTSSTQLTQQTTVRVVASTVIPVVGSSPPYIYWLRMGASIFGGVGVPYVGIRLRLTDGTNTVSESEVKVPSNTTVASGQFYHLVTPESLEVASGVTEVHAEVFYEKTADNILGASASILDAVWVMFG